MGDPNAPPLDSESLLGLLERHRVAYVLVGGLAAVAHGAMRATFDIAIGHITPPSAWLIR